MKKPVIDYRTFRLRKLTTPQFSHLWLLLDWVGFFLLFFLTEKFIPADRCFTVHIPLDDFIPFCEWFLIPYALWFGLIVFSLGYFLLYNIRSFKRLQTYIIITQIVAMAIYIIFPTRQDLRPEVFPRDNFLTQCVAFLYAIDTPTGVCPSLHVAYSFGIASVWLREKGISPVFKTFIVLLVALICLSTVFIKQHSALDFFAALPLCLLAEILVFGRNYRRIKA